MIPRSWCWMSRKPASIRRAACWCANTSNPWPRKRAPKTVILTTHNMDEADRMADRVAIIDHGKLLVLDTPAALKQRLGQGDTVEIKLENGLADSPADSLAYSQAAEAKARLALQDIASDVKLEAQANILHVRALHALGTAG